MSNASCWGGGLSVPARAFFFKLLLCVISRKKNRTGNIFKQKAPGENMATFAERVHCSVGVFSSVQSIVWPYFFVFALSLSLSQAADLDYVT